jgi:site-specific recombinase XerD
MKNTEKINKFVQWMQAKNMAFNTIKTYQSFIIKFLNYINLDSSRISKDDIQNYILSIPENFSDSYRNQAINSIKLYFFIVENKKIKDVSLPRPIKQQFIPEVLSPEQIQKVVFNTKNLKHKAILFCIYDNGLRISELINLKIMDLRVKKQRFPHLIIRETKYHKSRIIPISIEFINLISEYYRKYHPKDYLFEGQDDQKPYSKTSIRNILNNALQREKIDLKIRVHDLRHSFVTNCLANNTDIHHISKFIGHSSIKTTEKFYSHLNFSQLRIERRICV